MLDEQSFQNLLSAAFTIQEHNDRLRQDRETQAQPEARLEAENSVCPHCGAGKPTDRSRCEACGLDEFRPGERLQRNWASMWLMSQEQGMWPERSAEIREDTQEDTQKDVPPLEGDGSPRDRIVHNVANSGMLALPVARKEDAREAIAQEKTETILDRTLGKSALDGPVFDNPVLDKAAESKWTAETIEVEAMEDFAREGLAPEDPDPTVQPVLLSVSDDSLPTDARTGPLLQRLADVRMKLRFHRADLYLVAAVFVAAIALLWPAASAPRRTALLSPWERALVTLGIAEAPAPVVHFRGDPGIQVWVDPHTALYYCPGEEQYGKTPNGRFNSQREAQMDRFEPAGRSVCE
jgi:ribosomal protein L40E